MKLHHLRIRFAGCVGLATAVILLYGNTSQAIGQHADRDYFTVPKIAYSRSLGEITAAPCSPEASQVCQGAPPGMFDAVKGGYPMDVSGLGIPLGGIGAGSFMINQSGTFGPWNFGGCQDDRWEIRVLPQAAFHVREQYGTDEATVRTLATKGPETVGSVGIVKDRSWGSPLPAWHSLNPGDATYSALYPFGWITYAPFKTDVSIRFFSPIVVREDRRTSLPVAYFDVRLANHTGKTGMVSVMFTLPNAPGHFDRTPKTVRMGLSNHTFFDRKDGIQGLVLSSDDPSNTPDAKASEWTIAAKMKSHQVITFAKSWNADGDGSDVYQQFEKTGHLNNSTIDTSQTAGAICVSVRLRPGEVVTVPFVLAWDFPEVAFAKNKTIWMRRYTNFYGARETAKNDYIPNSYAFHQSAAIAKDAMLDHDNALKAVLNWWQPVVNESAYPTVLRTAALNQLYSLVFNNSFWEGGLVSNEFKPTFGKRAGIDKPGLHLFANLDGGAGNNVGNSIDVNSYNYRSYNLLFPSLEKDRLYAFAEAEMDAPNWTDAITDMSDGPFVSFRDLPACAPGKTNFIDIPSKLIYRYYAAARMSGDDQFLHDTYPAMRKALSCLQNTIPAGKHLPTAAELGVQTPEQAGGIVRRPTTLDPQKLHFANTFDAIPVHGPDIYDSELYLLALEVFIDTSKRLNEPSTVTDSLNEDLQKARSEFELTFWDPDNQFYIYTPGPSPREVAAHLDTFFAQHVAEELGLPDLVNLNHYRTQLTSTYSRFMALSDAQGRPLGAPDMIVGKGATEWPYIGIVGSVQEESVTTGVNFFVASTYVHAGDRFKDPLLHEDGLKMATAVAAQIWENDKNAFAFDAPESWQRDDASIYIYPAYERPLSVWDLLDNIRPLARSPHTPSGQ